MENKEATMAEYYGKYDPHWWEKKVKVKVNNGWNIDGPLPPKKYAPSPQQIYHKKYVNNYTQSDHIEDIYKHLDKELIKKNIEKSYQYMIQYGYGDNKLSSLYNTYSPWEEDKPAPKLEDFI